MPIPTYEELAHPLLLLLHEHPDGLRKRDAEEHLAMQFGLTDEERAKRLPSGRQRVFSNRCGWAHDRLKRAGLSRSHSRGFWRLTPEGHAFAKKHPDGFDADTARWMRNPPKEIRLGAGVPDGLPVDQAETPGPPIDATSPEERIDSAVEELNTSLADELLATIMDASPPFFERLVLDVLVAMGYGAADASVAHTGKSGDEGIDGLIALDRLGLEKVYVQAKRWKNTVGRPDIQGFFGALAGRRAAKGVFITTSGFSKEAREYAANVSGGLVLVDGHQLARLMIEYGVGVSVERVVKIARIDSDYFEDA